MNNATANKQWCQRSSLTWRHCVALFIIHAFFNTSLANEPLQLKEVRWLAPNSDKVIALTKKPPECLNPQAPMAASLGTLAFQSPALLGGQAAKMSLSCASCHPSGRANKHFFIDNISDKPGTADITHSFFSTKGGNNTLNPSSIPDLADLEQSTIKNRQSDAFRKKLTQLIEIEFDGHTPPKEVLDGLQAYLLHSNIKYCDSHSPQNISLHNDWQDLLNAVNILAQYPTPSTNTFIIRAARTQIESVYWRFINVENPALHARLIQLSRELEKLSTEHTSQQNQIQQLTQWKSLAAELYRDLESQQHKSTYNPEVVKQLISKY